MALANNFLVVTVYEFCRRELGGRSCARTLADRWSNSQVAARFAAPPKHYLTIWHLFIDLSSLFQVILISTPSSERVMCATEMSDTHDTLTAGERYKMYML